MEEHCYIPVADTDLQIRGGPGHPDPEIRGPGFKKNFFWPFGPQFGSKIRGEGWAGPPAPPLDLPLYSLCH